VKVKNELFIIFSSGIGVYGTDNLLIENNVIYHGVNELLDVEGANHTILNNLIAMSFAEGTFKVTPLTLRIR